MKAKRHLPLLIHVFVGHMTLYEGKEAPASINTGQRFNLAHCKEYFFNEDLSRLTCSLKLYCNLVPPTFDFFFLGAISLRFRELS